MTWMTAGPLGRAIRPLRGAWLAALLLGATSACGLLDVSDPTAIEEGELNGVDGAYLLRNDILRKLATAIDDPIIWGGLLSDEFSADPEFSGFSEGLFDRRLSHEAEAVNASTYDNWQEVRRAASAALPKLRAYAPPPRVAEAYAYRGYASMRLAEDICPGFPLNDIVDFKPVFGPPLTTDQAFTKALADFDSALALATDSARILNFVKIGRARTLLGLGQFADAGSSAAGVPVGFVTDVQFLAGYDQNLLGFGVYDARSVADREGINGLDFISSHDPRIDAVPNGFFSDGTTPKYSVARYTTYESPVVVANGIEAALIQAEAAFHTGGDWLGMLNALRTTCTDAGTCPTPAPAGTGGVAGLPPLSDPGSDAVRVDLIFRERAFWLYATGHRVADLRRLIHWYGRDAESVFPTGPHPKGGTYSTGTSLPFSPDEEMQFNPAVTGCTSR